MSSYSCISRVIVLYPSGQPIPRVEYREDEIATWKFVYNQLDKLFETHACEQHIKAFRLMEKEIGYTANSMPQLEDVSQYLKSMHKIFLKYL